MSLPQYGTESSWGHVIAIPASILFHVGLALLLFNTPVEEEKTEEVWLEMDVIQKEKEPEKMVEVEIEEEPEPEFPKPKKIDFKDIPPEPVEKPPPEPPPETKKQVRRVQGLKATSFSEGGQTGLNVRAGTTLQTSASNETLSIKEASESTAISYAAATTQPRLKKRPPLEIPQSVIDNGIEGTVQIVISINADGSVSDAKITKKLHPDADSACLTSWSLARFKPAKQGDSPVSITNFPRRCRFKAMD